MGRGKVQLRRIDNTTIRNVTFCKRRCGLFKKARELATLCDADVALIVFSSSGIPFHYASPRGMKEIVQRYLRRQLDSASTVQSHIQDREILHLQRQLDDLQQQQRRLNSNTDGLKHLSIEELTRLEQTVSHALRNIRSKKDDMSSERISHLLRTERDLESKNDAMKKQVLDQLQAERGVLAMCPPLYDQPLTSQELRRISINRYSSACVDHSATQDEPMLQLRLTPCDHNDNNNGLIGTSVQHAACPLF